MKKILFLSFLLIAFGVFNLNCFSQRSYQMELLNLVQINETEFRFDVRFKNTAADPVTNFIAVEGMQFQVEFNTAMLNGGGLNNTYLTYVTGTTDLVGAAISPLSSRVTANLNQTQIQWVTSSLDDGGITTMINHNNWVRIGTFRVILKASSSSASSKNFASVVPNLSLIPSGCICNWCNVDFVDPDYLRSTGSSSNLITNQTLSNSTVNKALYSHAFTATGNYSDAVHWNNSVDATDATYHVVPTVTSHNVSIGTLSTTNPLDAVPGVCILTTNEQVNDLYIKSTSTLTMNAVTQLSVDGNLYNENPTAGSLTLKSDASATASLINNTASVTATVERYIPAWVGDFGWHLLSAPVSNQAIDPNFTDQTPANYDFYKWDPSTALWRNQKETINNITNFTPGTGYLVSYYTAGTHNFAGTLNVGDASPAISYYTSTLGTWNLIGNPYPCAIRGNMSNWTRTNIGATVYVLDNANTYKVYNVDNIGDLPNGEIPAMQGFLVESLDVNPSITIPVTEKIHGTANFLKTTLNNQLSLNVQSPNATKAVCFIYFKNENNNGVDPNDGSFLTGFNPLNTHIYSYINSKPYVINALGAYSSPIDVQLGFEPKISGNFTITAADVQSFSSATHIWLQDSKTNTTQDLRTMPVYSFLGDTSDAVNRFKLIFDLGASGISPVTAAVKTIYSFENTIYIQSTDKVSFVSVYNMLGQEVESFRQPASNVISLHQASGYYSVRVITDGGVFAEKVRIK